MRLHPGKTKALHRSRCPLVAGGQAVRGCTAVSLVVGSVAAALVLPAAAAVRTNGRQVAAILSHAQLLMVRLQHCGSMQEHCATAKMHHAEHIHTPQHCSRKHPTCSGKPGCCWRVARKSPARDCGAGCEGWSKLAGGAPAQPTQPLAATWKATVEPPVLVQCWRGQAGCFAQADLSSLAVREDPPAPRTSSRSPRT